jgi:hypothetical protein
VPFVKFGLLVTLFVEKVLLTLIPEEDGGLLIRKKRGGVLLQVRGRILGSISGSYLLLLQSQKQVLVA